MSNKLKRLLSRNKQHKSIQKTPSGFNLGKNDKALLATMTAEPLQLVRIHYDLADKNEAERTFKKLKCMDFDPAKTRWTWNYHEEAKDVKFKQSYADISKEYMPIVLGSFYFPTEQHMYLDVNSFDRTMAAIKFFDEYLSREVAFLSHLQVVNKLFEAISGVIPSQDDHLDRLSPEKPDNKLGVEQITADKTLSETEKMDLVQQRLDENLNKPLPEVESLPIHFYEEGIGGLEGVLRMRHIIAVEHFKGNLDFSFRDIFQKLVPGM